MMALRRALGAARRTGDDGVELAGRPHELHGAVVHVHVAELHLRRRVTTGTLEPNRHPCSYLGLRQRKRNWCNYIHRRKWESSEAGILAAEWRMYNRRVIGRAVNCKFRGMCGTTLAQSS